MEGTILAMIIVSPIACCIGIYRLFNHGELPCVDTSDVNNLNRVVPEN